MGLGDLDKFIGTLKNSWQAMTSPATLNDYNYVNQNMSISKAEEAANNLSIGRRLDALGDAFKGGSYYETADKYADNIRDRYAKHRQDVRSNVSDDNTIAGQGIQNTAAMTNEFVNQSTVDDQILQPKLANRSTVLSNIGQNLNNTLAARTQDSNVNILANTAESGTIANQQALKMNPKLLEGQNLLNEGKRLANETIGINNLTLGDINRANLRGLNLGNNQLFQQMKHDQVMNPLLQNAQVLSNDAQSALNAHNKTMYPMLQNQQQKLLAAQHWQNQISRAQALGNNEAPFMLGGTMEKNFTDGTVVRLNPTSGRYEPIKVTPAIKNLYAAEETKKLKQWEAEQGLVRHPIFDRYLSDGEIQADKEFNKEVVGGRDPGLNKNNQIVINEVIDQLENKDLTGYSWNPLNFHKNVARAIDRESDLGIWNIVDPAGANAQQLVAGVIQQQLRATLGAQFTQKEGMLLIQRAYNPGLSEEYNIRRLKSWQNLMNITAQYQQAKINYNAEKGGTIAGFDYNGEHMKKVDQAIRNVNTVMNETGGDGFGGSNSNTNNADNLSTGGLNLNQNDNDLINKWTK